MSVDIFKTYRKMLKESLFASWDVVELDIFIKNREVAGLAKVGIHAQKQPKRVVVESAADAVVAAFGKRLVLMVTTAVRELSRRYVKDSLACPTGNLMYYSQKILIGIPESHSASDAALVEAGAAAHQERDHALVLIPDVDHPVKLRHTRNQREIAQKSVPVTP